MSFVLRQASSTTRAFSCRRALSASAVTRKDLVQDLYIKELRAYKPAPVAQNAHVGNVKAYHKPAAPNAPALPSDMASELSAYDAQEPTKASAAPKPASGALDEGPSGAEAFLEMLEADLPKEDHAHH